ncbi:hypothetical protein BDQ17DRAFT_731237 [Cyathus striatus]|nr:hypothetical protein BDQ17DRAFT_731237 [Cyathus striatus]
MISGQSNQPGNVTLTLKSVGEGPAATELLRVLLQYLNSEFTRNAIRNVHSSLRIVTTADQLNADIQALINSVDSETDYNTAWLLFQKYSSAIEPLESALLELSFAEDDKALLGHLPPSDNITHGVTFIERWVTHRDLIASVLRGLVVDNLKAVSPELYNKFNQEVLADRKHDDRNTMSELSKSISSSILADKNVVQRPAGAKSITSIKSTIQRISVSLSNAQANFSDDLRALAIRTAMLICAAFSILCNPHAPVDVKKRLRETHEIWASMTSLLQGISQHLANANAPSISSLEKDWERLKELLLGDEAVNFLPDLLKLIKAVANARRPFFGRAVVFVQICQVLCDHYDKVGENAADPESLKGIIQGGSEVLQAVSDVVKDVKAFGIDAADYSSIEQKFESITANMGDCFKQYDMKDWEKYEARMKFAAEQDKKNFRAFKKRIAGTIF